jgi:hypothetical protein
MRERPILFSAPMVRAILDGRKTQTRRIIKWNGQLPEFCGPRGCQSDPTCWGWEDGEWGDWITLEKEEGQRLGWRDLNVANQAGDTLWVREGWRTLHKWNDLAPRHLPDDQDKIDYLADDGVRNPLWAWGKGRPSIHMPRWASRISLKVTNVKVERLQHISEADAEAEGPLKLRSGRYVSSAGEQYISGASHTAIEWFSGLWTSINGAASWESNPWVVAYSFERIKP